MRVSSPDTSVPSTVKVVVWPSGSDDDERPVTIVGFTLEIVIDAEVLAVAELVSVTVSTAV